MLISTVILCKKFYSYLRQLCVFQNLLYLNFSLLEKLKIKWSLMLNQSLFDTLPIKKIFYLVSSPLYSMFNGLRKWFQGAVWDFFIHRVSLTYNSQSRKKRIITIFLVQHFLKASCMKTLFICLGKDFSE